MVKVIASVPEQSFASKTWKAWAEAFRNAKKDGDKVGESCRLLMMNWLSRDGELSARFPQKSR